MVFNSIRLKLTAWYVVLLAIILILFSVLLYLFLSKRLYEGIDNSLKVSANVVAKTTLMRFPNTRLPGFDQYLERFLGYANFNKFYRIYDGSGNVGPRSKNIDASQFPLTQEAYAKALDGETSFETFTFTSSDDQMIRVVTKPILRNGKLANLIQVGTSLQAVNETMHNLRVFLYTGIPGILVLATLVGGFMARRALKPVDKITQSARAIGSGVDLSKRIHVPQVQDEIGRLAITFNDMLESLEDSFSQIRQFSSDASHELRTPLTVLKGQSELVLTKLRNPEEYQEVLSSNLEEINYMSKILEDLFFLSKSDETKIKLDRKIVNLTSVIEEICKHAEIMGDDKKIQIVIAYLEPVEIEGDSVRLRQMVWNFLSNAIKYTPEQGTVKVSLQNQEKWAILTVEDTGIGIPEKHLSNIFNRFYRIDKARSRQEGGSGLGLAICKYIVESHQGEIQVDSEVGKGTRFKIRLPKVKVGLALTQLTSIS